MRELDSPWGGALYKKCSSFNTEKYANSIVERGPPRGALIHAFTLVFNSNHAFSPKFTSKSHSRPNHAPKFASYFPFYVALFLLYKFRQDDI